MSVCHGCETLPPPLPETGVLYLAPPLPHTQRKLSSLLMRAGIDHREPHDGVFSIELWPGGLGKLGLELADLLSRVELEGCKSLLAATGAEPTLADLVRMEPLSILVGRIRGDWLRQMLAEGRLVAHFQPIVAAASPQTVFGHECLVRGRERNGPLVPPDEVFAAARDAGLLSPLDRAARMESVRACAGGELEGRVFVNLDLAAIHDPALCLRSMLSATTDAWIAPERIVFEIKESEAARDGHLAAVLAFVRQNGFEVALDDVGKGLGSLALLEQVKPDYVKLGMELIRGIEADPGRAELARRLLDAASGLGVGTIAVGVETPEESGWLQDRGIGYLQGFYIAPAAGVPAAAPVH